MMLERILWVTLLSGLIILLAINHLSLHENDQHVSQNNGKSFTTRTSEQSSFEKLIELVKIQNETIHALEYKLLHLDDPTLPQFVHNLTIFQQQAQSVTNPTVADYPSSEFPTTVSKDRQVCESKYGMQLASIWKKNEEIWCEDPDTKAKLPSQLKCYPYHQAHKKLDGRSADLICEAYNFIIDFTKIEGSHAKTKPHLGDQYLNFVRGSLTSPCKKTAKYRERLFMPHHALQMRSFQSEVPFPNEYVTVTTPTYLLARDEDCENAFHSTADFMNMFLVKNVLDLPLDQTQVILFDKHPDGPFLELIQKAYSPNHEVIRHNHYPRKKVLFSRLIFHLESPAGLIFPKVARPDPLRCFDMSLFQEYRKFILKSFALLDVPPPPIPTVTMVLRHRTPQKNVGRILANEKEIVDVLKTGNMMKLNVVDTAKMSYYEQLKMIRHSNVVVGVHGAGLMFIMFAAEEAVLVEIHPSYRQDRHFRHAARMTNKIYMPMRTTVRETCQGTSDNVFVEVEEFRKTMDGALRVARNFDDGLSECGLVCPKSILAIDSRLDSHYTTTDRKGVSLNTHFPCG